MIDLQIFTDRMLETENLTDDLEDTEARWLLEWGLRQVPLVVAGCQQDEELAGERIGYLMNFIRRTNRLVSRKNARPIEAMANELQTLEETYRQAFMDGRSHSEQEIFAAASQLPGLSPMAALAFLTGFYSPPAPPEDKEHA